MLTVVKLGYLEMEPVILKSPSVPNVAEEKFNSTESPTKNTVMMPVQGRGCRCMTYPRC